MYKTIVLLTLCAAAGMGSDKDLMFRFDYTFNEKADGWLKFHRYPSTWNDAKTRCFAEGAILATPVSDQQREAILEYVSKEPIDAIFIGIHATYSGKDYTSIEGIQLSRLPVTWSKGEPKGASKNCLVIKTKSGTISDVKCNNHLPYVCYKKRAKLTINECGTHDTEYKLDARTGSCYKFHRTGLIWTKAYMTCVAEGGHLAIINSEQESVVLTELFAKNNDASIISSNTGSCHLGFRDLKNGGSWMTIHGQTLIEAGFSRWAENQPDNAFSDVTGGENCGTIFRNGQLNDIYCGRALAFICEKNPNSLLNII